jgi:hypothetical protein
MNLRAIAHVPFAGRYRCVDRRRVLDYVGRMRYVRKWRLLLHHSHMCNNQAGRWPGRSSKAMHYQENLGWQ